MQLKGRLKSDFGFQTTFFHCAIGSPVLPPIHQVFGWMPHH